MSPADAMALGAVSQAKTLIALAQAMGWVRTSTDRSLERIDEQLRLAFEAPLHEGLDRLEVAAQLDNPWRRQELVDEARSKLHDAAARPGMPPHAVAVACITCAALAHIQGDAKEARFWLQRALDAYDSCLLEAHREASSAALMNVGEKVAPSPSPWPKATWTRIRRRASILRACMGESTENVQALTARVMELNAEVAEAHIFAADHGVGVDGRCREVTVRTFKAVIVLVKLGRVEPRLSAS